MKGVDFNSMIVRLKGMSNEDESLLEVYNFNSMIVRLKGGAEGGRDCGERRISIL